ncbi:MAG: hypothetical protein ACPHJ3_20075, partial [Rubripirellula sp.]
TNKGGKRRAKNGGRLANYRKDFSLRRVRSFLHVSGTFGTALRTARVTPVRFEVAKPIIC